MATTKKTRPAGEQPQQQPSPEGIAHRLPDKMIERLAGMRAERDRRAAALKEANVAIGECLSGFLMARGQDLDEVEGTLSDDGRAVMVRPKKAPG